MTKSHKRHFLNVLQFLTVLVAVRVLGLPAPAEATGLIFDPVNLDFERVDQAYGDRVIMTPQDGFEYGTEEGFTPNVKVEYGPLPAAIPALWTTGYGDLVNVLFEDQDGFGRLEVTIAADPGWHLVLHRFDMAAWSAIEPIQSVSVRDQDDDVLFAEFGVPISEITHTSFAFDPPLVGQVLILGFDASNLGSQSDNVAIDNIVFSQVRAPVPVRSGTWAQLKTHYR